MRWHIRGRRPRMQVRIPRAGPCGAMASAGLTLALVATAGIVWAQGQPASTLPPTIQVHVEQVLVPVVVTDHRGHFITDLKAGDFHVFEDGVEQKLVALRTEATGAAELFPSESGPELPAGVVLSHSSGSSPTRHTYLITLDARFSSFGNFTHVRDALEKLFKEDQGVDSQYALVALGRPTRVIQNLTRDPQAVLAAIENKGLTTAILSSESSNVAQQESELVSKVSLACRGVCRSYCGGGKANTQDWACSSELARIISLANSASLEQSAAERSFVSDLRSLTEQLSRMPGRRVLILTSDGFSFRPGSNFFQLIAYSMNHPELVWKNDAPSLQEEIEAIAKLANGGNVTFYTLDSRGLFAIPAGGFDATQDITVMGVPQAESAAHISAREQQDAMSFLATTTGGIFYHNQNDMLKGLRESLADGRSYYVLAYASTNHTADGKFRRIRLEVRGKNLVVRAKIGYWAAAGNTP